MFSKENLLKAFDLIDEVNTNNAHGEEFVAWEDTLKQSLFEVWNIFCVGSKRIHYKRRTLEISRRHTDRWLGLGENDEGMWHKWRWISKSYFHSLFLLKINLSFFANFNFLIFFKVGQSGVRGFAAEMAGTRPIQSWWAYLAVFLDFRSIWSNFPRSLSSIPQTLQVAYEKRVALQFEQPFS